MIRVPIWKIAFIVVVLLFALWLLVPSFQYYSIDAAYRNRGTTAEIENLKEKLESGEITNPVELQDQLRDLQNDFREVQNDAIRLGLDLQGGVHLVIEVDLEQYREQLEEQGMSEDEITFAMDTVLDSAAATVGTRVDAYGVAEAAIVKQEPNRIILEMPGFGDPEIVADLVQAEAQLRFHNVAPASEMGRILSDIDAYVNEDLLSLIEDRTPSSQMAAVVVSSPDTYEMVDEILNRDDVQSIIGQQYIFRWGDEQEPNNFYDFPHRYLYLLESKTSLTGASLTNAYPYMNRQSGMAEVSIEFDGTGSRIFAQITRDNVGENLAIVLDGRVKSAPRIQNEIRGGQASITGIGEWQEARQTAVVLRAGSLPAPLSIENSRVVGPSLGADSIRSGIWAGITGGVLVLVFMIFYYAVCGVVANIAVVLNLILLIAGMAMFKATLTLPGIAGIVLMIGMAVDANVLIYERIREEMKGKRARGLQLVLDKAYGRAFMTIFDANITTLITALVLFQFGTGPIKGFAVTLSLGILISLFTAVFVTRVIFDIMASQGMKQISAGKLAVFENANFDFMRKPGFLMGITSVIGVAGFLVLALFWNSYKGIDFAGGTEVMLEFQETASVQEARDSLDDVGLGNAVIQRVLDAEQQMLVRVEEGVVETTDELLGLIHQAMPDKEFNVIASESVGAKVGGELLMQGIYCIIFASIGILLYITARFEFRFALAAVAALFHDLFFTLSMLAITGTDFNLPIIAALLTVLGYSLNDTIVVFDRIRENYASALLNFKDVVNESINQTLSRTVLTSGTTLFVLGTLYVVGGSVIHDFAFTLLVGIVVGTYSSIFVASPILVLLGKQKPSKAPAPSRKDRGEPVPAAG